MPLPIKAPTNAKSNDPQNALAAGYDPDLAEGLWRLMMEHFIAQEARALGETDAG